MRRSAITRTAFGCKDLGWLPGCGPRWPARSGSPPRPRPSASGRCRPCTGRARRLAPHPAAGRSGPVLEPGMQPARRRAEQLTAAHQIDPVVHVTSVSRAPPGGHDPPLAQLAQVIRDQVLGFAEQRDQLADPPSLRPNARRSAATAADRRSAAGSRADRRRQPPRDSTSIQIDGLDQAQAGRCPVRHRSSDVSGAAARGARLFGPHAAPRPSGGLGRARIPGVRARPAGRG